MAVTANDFQQSAIEIAQKKSEIDIRNAISRSYYSSYHIALQISQQLPSVDIKQPAGSHERVIQILTKQQSSYPNCTNYRALGYILSKMRLVRHKADYELNLSFGIDEFETQLDDYNRFITKLSEIQATP